MKLLGLDAGSVSVKLVELDGQGNKVKGMYRVHRGHPLEVALEMLREAVADGGGYAIAVTGSAGRLIGDVLGIEPTNEIVAQAYASQKLYPEIKTVIEMGGEDSKLILLGEKGVEDFAMNSVCAAGTGSFLDQQSERLRLGIEEFSRLSLKSPRPPRIAGRCSVFAKSDMIHLQQIATPVEDIVAGLCFAVARNFRGSIARGRKIVSPVAFQGGVAANQGMVRAFKEIFELDDLMVPENFALMGALGAAHKALDTDSAQPFDIGRLDAYVQRERAMGDGHGPLRAGDDSFHDRHLKDPRDVLYPLNGGPRIPAYMGIDIGSISTNVAVVDSEGKLLAKRYLMTAGRPIEAVRQGLREVFDEVGSRVDIKGVGTTGSGRYMIADYVGADIVKNEITAQATAAAFIDPNVDTIFEIGGQDSKYVSLRDGVIVDFEMNKACAAGTGSFLEEQAEKLSISVRNDFADCAFSSDCPSRLGERCTVFMENSLMANLQRGEAKDNLLAGLSYSIVQNYINRVVAGRPVGKNIFFQGGVAFNKAVVAAFEKHLDVQVTVPPNHDVTGAIGMALIAMRYMMETGEDTSVFKGLDRSQVPYDMSSFECKGCSNLCEINKVQIEGEKDKLFYGGRCEKYDMNRKDTSHIPNLFKFRDDLLWKHIEEESPTNGRSIRGRIGVPYIFFFNEYLPYWSVLLKELRFEPVISPRPNRQIVDLGLESVISEACYPVKVALGHIRYLRDMGVDAILSPSFKNLNTSNDEYDNGAACPHTQTIPYVARVALDGIETLEPLVDLDRGQKFLARELKQAFAKFGVGMGDIQRAMKKAQAAQNEFYAAVRQKGREVIESLDSKTLVVVGRAYNAFERGMNLQIPEKLATLGVLAIPMDMLPIGDISIKKEWPNMYWRSGQRILRAARYIREHKLLYPLFIGNFSCGPDSFILKFFKEELQDKPFLHIEIDEHSADAGAVTRCEAFLDSIENRDDVPSAPIVISRNGKNPVDGRMVYVPRMSDHAFALAAAFERSGVRAEVMPESDRRSVDMGMKYASGKECYPCIVTTGDMLRQTREPGFDPERSVFFMPSGTGPCRFGQYNVFHQKVLDKVGMPHVPVFAPNQDKEFYKDLGMAGKDFALHAWRGVVAIELLLKCLHETRPYEVEAGTSDALHSTYLKRLYNSLRGANGRVEDVLSDMRKDFEALPRTKEKKPLIGVVGEIFVRTNRFSNEDLIRRIESLGGEVWLAPVEEWIYYVNSMGIRHSLIKRDGSAILSNLTKRFFKKKTERAYARFFEGFLKTLHEPSTSEVLRKAAPYVRDTFEGETVLSMGKAVDLVEHGAAGIVSAMPFGCMPGTIVSALLRALTRDYNVPAISMPYDGTESSTTAIQLEAFMDQAWNSRKQRR
jgi:predicted CoA-substrate-specific enzyme activase